MPLGSGTSGWARDHSSHIPVGEPGNLLGGPAQAPLPTRAGREATETMRCPGRLCPAGVPFQHSRVPLKGRPQITRAANHQVHVKTTALTLTLEHSALLSALPREDSLPGALLSTDLSSLVRHLLAPVLQLLCNNSTQFLRGCSAQGP